MGLRRFPAKPVAYGIASVFTRFFFFLRFGALNPDMVVLIQKISEAFAKDKWISLGITLILASPHEGEAQVQDYLKPSRSLVRGTYPIL